MSLNPAKEQPPNESKEKAEFSACQLLEHEAHYTASIIPPEFAKNLHRTFNDARDYGISLTGYFDYEKGDYDTYQPDLLYDPNVLFILSKMREEAQGLSREQLIEYLSKTGLTTFFDIGKLGLVNTKFGNNIGDLYLLNTLDYVHDVVNGQLHPGMSYSGRVTGDEGIVLAWRNPSVPLEKFALPTAIARIDKNLNPKSLTEDLVGFDQHILNLIRLGILPAEFSETDENGDYRYFGLKHHTVALSQIPAPEPDHNRRGTDLFEYLMEWSEKLGISPQSTPPAESVVDTLADYILSPISQEDLEAIRLQNQRLPHRYQVIAEQAKQENQVSLDKVDQLSNEACFDNRHIRGEMLTHTGFYWQIADLAYQANPNDPLRLVMIADLEVKNSNKKGRLYGNEKMRNIATHIAKSTDFNLRAATQQGGSYLVITTESQIKSLQKSIREDSAHQIAISVDKVGILDNLLQSVRNKYARDPDNLHFLEKSRQLVMASLFGGIDTHKQFHYLQELITACLRLPQVKEIAETFTLLDWIIERQTSRYRDLLRSLDGDIEAANRFMAILGEQEEAGSIYI